MAKQNSNSTNETEVLREFYAALNRNDVPATLKLCDPQIERIEPEGFPTSGTYRGYAEVEPLFASARSTWAEGACEPERFVVNGDKVVVYVHVKVRLKDHADWIDAHIADGFVVRNGKVVQFRTYVDPKDALAWAGIKE